MPTESAYFAGKGLSERDTFVSQQELFGPGSDVTGRQQSGRCATKFGMGHVGLAPTENPGSGFTAGAATEGRFSPATSEAIESNADTSPKALISKRSTSIAAGSRYAPEASDDKQAEIDWNNKYAEVLPMVQTVLTRLEELDGKTGLTISRLTSEVREEKQQLGKATYENQDGFGMEQLKNLEERCGPNGTIQALMRA